MKEDIMAEQQIHNGCFYCGGGEGQKLLKSVTKPIIDAKGKSDPSRSVALCNACLSLPLLDFRVNQGK